MRRPPRLAEGLLARMLPAAVSLLAALLSGLVPALMAAGADPASELTTRPHWAWAWAWGSSPPISWFRSWNPCSTAWNRRTREPSS